MSIVDDLNKINNIKHEIRAAIRDKGVNIPDYAPFAEYPNYIRNISGGGNNDGDNGQVKQVAVLVSNNSDPVIPSDIAGQSNNYKENSFINGDGIRITQLYDVAGFEALKFVNCTNLARVNYIDTSRMKNMSNMFSGCTNLVSIDFKGANIMSGVNTDNMFDGCTSLREVRLDKSNGDVIRAIIPILPTNVIEGVDKVIYCWEGDVQGITPPDTWRYSYVNNSGGGDSGGGEVRKIAQLASINDTPVTASDVQGQSGNYKEISFVNGDGDTMTTISDSATLSRLRFANNQNLEKVFFINPTALTSMGSMFAGCQNLIYVDASNWDLSNITDTVEMFHECFGLTSLDLSGATNTSNIRYMNYMFNWCHNLETLDIRNFDISEDTECNDMFNGCQALKELRLDNCSRNTINKIITSSNFPTDAIDGVARNIYCKQSESYDRGLLPPENWFFQCTDTGNIVSSSGGII